MERQLGNLSIKDCLKIAGAFYLIRSVDRAAGELMMRWIKQNEAKKRAAKLEEVLERTSTERR